MKQTQNYQLSQWELADRIQMEDFNGDNAKIDAALGTLAAEVGEHSAVIPKLGNCQIYHQTYTGNGTDSRTFTFPRQPALVLLRGEYYTCLVSPGTNHASCYSCNGYGELGTAAWDGNSVTITMTRPYYLCNSENQPYDVVAWMVMG